MNSKFEVVPFSKIKDKIPEDAAAASDNSELFDDFNKLLTGLNLPESLPEIQHKDRTVLHFKGDVQFESLRLDAEFSLSGFDWKNTDQAPLILVDGNLTVDNYIYVDDMDIQGVDLIVLGNLKTRNAIVGGQEIYVAGNLEVEELFWGDYERGSLVVKGNASAAVFINTEYYNATIEGKKNFGIHFSDDTTGTDDYQVLQKETVSHYIVPECFEIEGGEVRLNSGEVSMLDFFAENKSIIIKKNV